MRPRSGLYVVVANRKKEMDVPVGIGLESGYGANIIYQSKSEG